MIAVKNPGIKPVVPHITVTSHRSSGQLMQLDLHIDDPLLEQGDVRIVDANEHARDHELEMTPLMRDILRRLFGNTQAYAADRIIIGHGRLTIFYWPREPFSQVYYLHLVRDAAFAVLAQDYL